MENMNMFYETLYVDKTGVKVKGFDDSYRIIDSGYCDDFGCCRELYLLQSETYGKQSEKIVIDSNLKVYYKGFINKVNDLFIVDLTKQSDEFAKDFIIECIKHKSSCKLSPRTKFDKIEFTIDGQGNYECCALIKYENESYILKLKVDTFNQCKFEEIHVPNSLLK